MAKSKTKASDINTLTSARLYQLLADPEFAKGYIIMVASTGDESKLRRAVEDLITALCIAHQEALRKVKRPPGAVVMKRVRSLRISCNEILLQRILKVWKQFSSDSVDAFLAFLICPNEALGGSTPLNLLRAGETERVIGQARRFLRNEGQDQNK